MSQTIKIKVIPRAKSNEVVERNGQLVVRVTAAPTDGKANDAVIKVLAKHLKVSMSQVVITRGILSRIKTITIQ